MRSHIFTPVLLLGILLTCCVPVSHAVPWRYTLGDPTYNPPGSSLGNVYSPAGPAVPMDAAVSENPPQITIKFYSGPTPGNTNLYNPNLSYLASSFDIFRKSPDTNTWSGPVGTVVTGSSNFTWTDTNVTVGQLYEYGVAPAGTTTMKYGFLLAGIKADRTQPRGRIVVVVASDIVAKLPTEYAQYKADLVADGWTVHEIQVNRAPNIMANGTGPLDGLGVPTAPFVTDHINTRNQIIALYNQYPGEVKNVAIIGKVTVPHSGHSGIGPDGHGNEAALGADAYYADMDGTWTDVESNAVFLPVVDYYNNNPNKSDGTVTIPSYINIPAASLTYWRTQGTGTYFGDASHPSGTWQHGSFAVVVSGTNVTGIYPTMNDFVNNADGSVTPPSYALPVNSYYLDQVKAKRLAGGGPFTISGYPYSFQVLNGNVTYMWANTYDSNISVSNGMVNVPGDNKFDAEYMEQITPNADLELGFGRIDFSNNIPAEYESMRAYFNKLHRYKIASSDFRPNRTAIQRASFGMVTEAFLESMPGIFGMSNISLTTTSDLPFALGGNLDPDQAYTGQIGNSALFYFKGSSEPAFSDGGKAVFWTGMQSHWGYWYLPTNTSSENVMMRCVSEDNFCLSYTWSIGLYNFDTSYLYHRMGMGYDAGDMMRISMSSRGGTGSGGYSSTVRYARTDAPLFMEHIGDPALRLFMFPPPSNLSIIPGSGGSPSLSWTASPEPGVIGYHVYRPATPGGPFTRITDTPVAATNYLDSLVNSGTWTYMVRAVRLETTGGGSVYNPSLGISQSINLSGASALQIGTATLPDSSWNTPYNVQLTAQGGTPLYSWTVDSGALPPGLSLSSNGSITGTATAGGVYSFTARVTDALSQTATKALTLTAQSNDTNTFLPEAGTYASSFNTSVWSFNQQFYYISGPTYNFMTFLRFNLTSLNTHNRLVRARLILSFDEKSQPGSYAQINTALTADAGDNWDENAMTYATRPLDQPNVPLASAGAAPVPFGTLEIDVTPQVLATLQSDPAKKVGLRLFTTAPSSFGNEIKISTRYSPALARPRLVIETTDAPAIAISSPSSNPASVYAGSALQINAIVTAIPARQGSVTTQWSKVSGPGTVTFNLPAQASTGVAFSAAGDYVIRLTANDGVLTSTQDLTVRVSPSISGIAPSYGPTDSLLMRLPLDESSGASVSNLATGTPIVSGSIATLGASGLPTWSPAGGRVGGAISFNGTNQRVEVADPGTSGTNLSISLWVKTNTTDANSRAIVVKRATTSSSTTSYALTLSTARKVTAAVANKTPNAVSTQVLAIGQWYHIVMIFDGTKASNNLQLYINGSPEAFVTVASLPTLPSTNAAPVRVGDYTNGVVGGTSLSLDGMVDDVRFYSRTLGWSEIQDLYNAAPANIGPRIVTAPSVSGTAGQPFNLTAVVTDDGKPTPPAAITLGWSSASGPGSVGFNPATAANTAATASLGGSYVLRLSANDGGITTFADVAANIIGGLTAYQQWCQANGFPIDGTGNGARSATPLNDGVTNAMKYALGLAYTVPGYGDRVTTGKVNVAGVDYLSLTYKRPEPAPAGVTYAVKTGADMSIWSVTDTADVPVGNPVTDGLRTITVRDTKPMADPEQKRFIRLEVVVAP